MTSPTPPDQLDFLAGGLGSAEELAAAIRGIPIREILADTGADFQEVLEQLPMNAELTASAIEHACKHDFLAFLTYEMGMEVAKVHREWWDLMRTGDDCVIMAPRDHGKSLVCARAYAIWKAKYDPFVNEIYILGPDSESAVENLDKLKELLLTRKSLVDLVPTNWQQGYFNNRTSLKLTNGNTIRAKSFFSRLRGRHPQLIISDDVLNSQNSDSEEKRTKVSDQFNSVVVPMKDKAHKKKDPTCKVCGVVQEGKSQLVTIGTAMAPDDLYHEQLESAEYKGIRQSAILVDDKFEPILSLTGERQALWPERYGIADLDGLRRKIGAVLFEREYMNKPIVDELSIFPPKLFNPLFDPTISYIPAYTGSNLTFMGVDFSVPGNQDGDFTVIFVVEYDTETRMYTPLNYWRVRPDGVRDQLNQIELFAQAYKVTKGYLESNAFQDTYAAEFRKKTNLPLEGHNVGSNKNSYIQGLLGIRPLLEAGAWRFPYKTKRDKQMTDLLVREFAGIVQRKGKLGNEAGHDDIPMAMWHAWKCAMDTVAGENWTQDWSW